MQDVTLFNKECGRFFSFKSKTKIGSARGKGSNKKMEHMYSRLPL